MKLSVLSSFLCVVGCNLRLVLSEPIPNLHRKSVDERADFSICKIVDAVVSDLRKFAPEATSFCSHLLHLPTSTATLPTTRSFATTTTVTVAGPGPVTSTTLPTVTITLTTTQTGTATETDTSSTTESSTETDTVTATATFTSVAVVIGPIPSYLTKPAAKIKRDTLPVPAPFKAWGLAALSTACSCLSLSGQATKTVTVFSTGTVQLTSTTPGPQTVITQTPQPLTTTAAALTTVTVTTQVTVTVVSGTTLTNTASTTVTVPGSQTQQPSAICNNALALSNANVDLGVNSSPAGGSARNNFGNYNEQTCCELCFNTPGCYLAYIVVEAPRPGQTPNNNCFVEYFPGTVTPGVCPNFFSSTPTGQRTFPADHFLIPGPCIIIS